MERRASGEIDSRRVISVSQYASAGKGGEHAARHWVDGARKRNVQQEVFRAGAARELKDEVVRLGRGRGA